MKIMTIVGARPQFVKAAVVSRAIALNNEQNSHETIKEVILHTGQHYDANMSDVFFKELCIPEPDYNLNICDCSHGSMTGRMLEQIETVILQESPDVVLVYGDTNSTLAGALAAAKLKVSVAHVEAGLRSYNMNMPEEINRVLTDRIAQFLFCPTDTAVRNLRNEGIGIISKMKPRVPMIVNVGDVMYDATLFYRDIAKPTKPIKDLIDNIGTSFYLATVHREENTNNIHRLQNILEALNIISQTTKIIFSVHPRTLKAINQYGLSLSNIIVIEPVGYFDMIVLLEHCNAVFTDSGGLQKEAYFFHKPCIVLRDETEWIELVEYGFNTVAGTTIDSIVKAERNIATRSNYNAMPLYGTGGAGNKIIQAITKHL